ncbi:hypothetical protein [Adhaeretor mobilis]|uniref:hypothetical protein n=1 Tax=Adhaeretor mobilis TaxID=1930276 RepID=UPI0011A1F1A3|nr:hypothetical protein [Adhaeretor mobilis]
MTFSIAGMAYWFFCPTLIRDFDSFEGFERSGRGFRYIPDLIWAEYDGGASDPDKTFSERIRDHEVNMLMLSYSYVRDFVHPDDWPKAPPDFADWSFEHMDANRRSESNVLDIRELTVLPEKKGEAFWYVHAHFEENSYRLRQFCLVSFLISYGCFSYVAIQGFWYVSKTIL